MSELDDFIGEINKGVKEPRIYINRVNSANSKE